MTPKHLSFTSVSLAILGLISAASLHAATFVVSGNDTGAKTLATGETGTVTSSGNLNVSGSTATVTVSGGTVSIDNAGLIRQTGTARTIDANVAGTALTITNSGTISSVGSNETIRMAQTANLTLTNQLGAFITSNAADAIRPGNNSTITNYGTISASPPDVASPAGSDGIDLRTERTGITINNSGTISGRHGIATDGANVGPSSITVNNYAGTIYALNGSGINVDGVSTTVTANVTNALGATIKGGVFSNATSGDGDGIDVDGVLTLSNSGDVLGLGAKGANNPEGIAAGGGSITNTSTGRIIGSALLADAPNGDTSKTGNGILIDDSNTGNAIAATTVTNSGLIQGKGGFGIKIIGTFADTITNNAGGTIRGSGALLTGDGGDTVTNRGSIIGDNGQAIDLEAGNDSLIIEGASASITGDISGGTGTNTATFNPGAGNTFSYAGAISNFSSVDISSGNVILSGASTYSGNTTVSGTLSVTNTTGSATGSGNVTVNSTGTLKGTGDIAGNVSVASGGTIAPGLSPGTLNIDGNLSIVDGSHFAFELGTTSDLLNIGGALNFTGGGTALFDILNTGSLTSGSNYTLMNYSSVSGLALSNLAFGSTPAGFAGQFTIGANALTLHVDAVPEPSRAVLGGLGLAVLTLRRRRKARHLAKA